MSLITVSEISKNLNVSTRTLRYYEQIGLIKSVRKESYAYRVYDETAVNRLQQIVVLRKLRIPLKQIALILQSDDTAAIIETFRQNLAEVDEELTALSTIRDIISRFIDRLNESIRQNVKLNLLDDTELLDVMDTLAVQRSTLKKEKNAADLEQASEKLSRLTDRDVRIIYLPPMTVASIHIIAGANSENKSADMLDEFIRTTNLETVYPAARNFGFNNPDDVSEGDGHGYERWISIPADMEVHAPFVKKLICGGLYAAHTIPFGAWDEWGQFFEWVMDSEQYEFRLGTIDGVPGWLEEHLNYWNWNLPDGRQQLDLLIPIQPKSVK